MADWKNFGIGMAQAATGGILSAGLSALFGGSTKRKLKMQEEAQKRLNEQAAELNYTYGEKSAENAYKRQLMMYERSYADQSYSAMRKQMENAGLSAGLMYGGSGSGGGQGTMTGAPQGATGGAIAGDASSQLSAAIALKQLKLQEATTIAQNAKAYAEADEIKSRKEKNEADTSKTMQETEQMRESFEWILKSQKEEARRATLDNVIKQLMMEAKDFKGEKEINDEKFGKIVAKTGAILNWQAMQGAEKIAIERDNVDGANKLREAQKLLEDKKTYYYATEVLASMIVAKATEMNAQTSRLEYGLHKIATEWNVKLTDAKIKEITNSIEMGWKELENTIKKIETEMTNETKETEFNTGGWAKLKIIMGALSALADAYSDVMGTKAKVIDAVTP